MLLAFFLLLIICNQQIFIKTPPNRLMEIASKLNECATSFRAFAYWSRLSNTFESKVYDDEGGFIDKHLRHMRENNLRTWAGFGPRLQGQLPGLSQSDHVHTLQQHVRTGLGVLVQQFVLQPWQLV